MDVFQPHEQEPDEEMLEFLESPAQPVEPIKHSTPKEINSDRSTSVKQRKRRVERSVAGSHRSQHGGHIRSLVANDTTEFKRFTYRPIREWRQPIGDQGSGKEI